MLLSGKTCKLLEHSASSIEKKFKAFVSAASRFNNNYIYQYPSQNHAEIPVEITERCHMECHVQCPTVHHCNCCSKNQREPNNNNRSQGYEHYYSFMATMVDPNTDAPGEDNESIHPSRAPYKLQVLTKNILPQRRRKNCMKRTGNCTQFYEN